MEMLCLIYGVLGIEYGETLVLLRASPEAADSFLSAFISDLGELLQEFEEKKSLV
jgi:hypothetical protein